MKKRLKTELITEFMKENNLSKTAFCKLCRISTATLNKLLAGNYKVNIVVVFKIEKTIKKKINELFE